VEVASWSDDEWVLGADEGLLVVRPQLMALSTHSGGAADKAGFFHESLWGVRCMLDVLNGDAECIRIETPGDDGAEFYLQRGKVREHWQAKRQVTGQETWTLAKLEGVLEFFFKKFRAGESCVFASVSDAPELRMLTENAQAARKAGETVDNFKSLFLDKKRKIQFKELENILGAVSDDETFAFLCAITVHGGREITLEPEFGFRLAVMFQGPWQNTMAVLRDLFLQSTHETLTAGDIERHLHASGIVKRRGNVPDAVDRIIDVTRGYVEGQRAKLIRGTAIRRSVADDLVAKIKGAKTSLDTFIMGTAGGGKSACMCQIVQDLQLAGLPVLAFRLDRVEPVATAILLGVNLGLGESPARVLADSYPNQPVVLVIDQLDCVSSSSGRRPDFFDTIAALRAEVLGLRPHCTIHLILACRKFDFEHDHRLKQLATKDHPPIELVEFTFDEVRSVLQREGADISNLTPQQQAMLRLPQNLSLFVDAGLARTANRFSTSKDLCDAYWTEKRRAVSDQRPELAQYWLPAIQHLAITMSDQQELSVPATVMDGFPPEFLDRMTSEGVLTWDGKRYGFGHETFFDYCFARTQPNGGRDFVRFLENDTQHLFRRAQLRQVLVFLRDDNFSVYLASFTELLRSSQIRPHLKLLAVDLLSAYPQASDDEFGLLMPWIEGELACRGEARPNPDKLGSRIWDRFFLSRTLFKVADRAGFIDRWLKTGESWLQDTMALYLRWQLEVHADRVAELLEPFVEKEGWRTRLRFMMEWGNLEKSRRFFDLFLCLLDNGTLDDAKDRFAANGTFWSMIHGLAEQRPDWCAELAARWLNRQVVLASASSESEASPRLRFDDDFGVNDLFTSARGNPVAYLENVLPAIISASVTFAFGEDEEELPRDRLWPSRVRSEHIGLCEAFLSACETALKLVGQQSPDPLRPFINQLRSRQLYTTNHLLLSAYESNPGAFADEALGLLSDEPKRLKCGYSDSAYWRARQVITKCSPLCSIEIYQKLETVVLALVAPYERTNEGVRFRGHAAYNFVSSLPEARLSATARLRLSEWKEKFKEPDGAPVGIRSYRIISPIEEASAKKMTDEQWLREIAKYNTEERIRDSEHPERGGALELARMLQKFTEEQPERFAQLTLQLPENAHPYYFSHVLRGLVDAAIPYELKLAAVRRVFSNDHRDCLDAALSLLASMPVPELPEDAQQYIQRAAGHPDPQTDLWAGEAPYYGGDMLTHGINCVRGHVAGAIRDLIVADARYVSSFSETIEKLVGDPSLAVRACVASTLLAVARHDVSQALWWSGTLFEADDRLLATEYVQRFINMGLEDHFERVAPVIQRMLGSNCEKVREAGGTLACLGRLYHDEADDLSEAALAGDEHCRLGACQVANSNLLDPETRAWCEGALVRLFADENKEVLRKAAHCFWHLWQSPDTPISDYDSLIRSFLRSPAFPEEPTYLLYALEDNRHRLPEATLDVCEVFITRCAEAARDIRTSIAGDEMRVGKLVFAAYAQLQPQALQIRALDLIDRMSIEGLSSASTHLSEFER
jgi:hypothetical protein